MIWLIAATYLAIGVIAFRDMLRLILKDGLDVDAADLATFGYAAIVWPFFWPAMRLAFWDWPEINQDFIKKIAGWKEHQ